MKTAIQAVREGSCKKTAARDFGVPIMALKRPQEAELVDHILYMETRVYEITTCDVRFLAFKKRHPELTIRNPEATSVVRARASNKPVVTKFYALLKTEVVEKKILAHSIVNVDKTSLNTVQLEKTLNRL
ncbi:hypothetical protein ILUMI_00524 [Ignelater luminosus]|uniref:Uncharacterized protein n=1 Tax=Ignelater luminosus TaxID=2038154 RepID=A0A8K0DLG1_IGNLU|nr:hypothetical protein ILUMI_00524 [Ignelater luminosus]